MSDIVVTVPKTFTHPCAPGAAGLFAWLAEGDASGEPATGVEWAFSLRGPRPNISQGERVYVVCTGRLVGYAPLTRIDIRSGAFDLIRRGGAVACTIASPVLGFRGWRYRWWDRSDEYPLDLSAEIAAAQRQRTTERRQQLAALTRAAADTHIGEKT